MSEPVFRYNSEYELPVHTNDAEKIIATGGKVCYDAYGHDGRSVKEHIRSLVGSGHFSVIEHVNIGLFLGGISRGCSHEVVRHRHFSYSQRSTRYTAEEGAAIVLDPDYAAWYKESPWTDGEGPSPDVDTYSPEEFLLLEFFHSCNDSLTHYRDTVDGLLALNPKKLEKKDLRKWARGKARQLLPHALETRMVMTGNLRAWRHFLILRTSRGAEAEIRRLAHEIYGVIKGVAPTVFEDFKETIFDGYVELTTSHREAE